MSGFAIDTGNVEPETLRPYGSFGKYEHDDGLDVDLSNWQRADRFKRQCIAAIWGVESINDLEGYMASQYYMLDALLLAHPEMSAEVTENEKDCRAGFAGTTHQSAQADTSTNSLGIEF